MISTLFWPTAWVRSGNSLSRSRWAFDRGVGPGPELLRMPKIPGKPTAASFPAPSGRVENVGHRCGGAGICSKSNGTPVVLPAL